MVNLVLKEFEVDHRKSVFNGKYVKIYMSCYAGRSDVETQDADKLRRMAQDLMLAADYLDGEK